MSITTSNTLLADWQRQFRPMAKRQQSRKIGALALQVQGATSQQLVRLNRLTLFAVYDEHRDGSQLIVRVCGYRPKRIAHGVEWAGEGSSFIFKNLATEPKRGAKGQRLELHDERVLRQALDLNRCIDASHQNAESAKWAKVRMPRVWAGFWPHVVAHLHGSGPEFERICQRFEMASDQMFRLFQRWHHGLVLFPVDWLNEAQLASAKSFFADLDRFPRRQVFRIGRFPDRLKGFQGASAFDLYSNRFRRER